VIEIKCGAKTYDAALDGIVPKHYYGQLQHILMATGLPAIDFWAFSETEGGILLPVNRDDDYIARLLDAEKHFWNQVTRERR
jgi:predicted phage-related endonuclease